MLDEAVELGRRIVRIAIFYLGPDLLGLPALVVQVLEDQFVLRVEVAIERHLVGAGGFRDRLHADPADAVTVKKVLRACDDPVARPGRTNS